MPGEFQSGDAIDLIRQQGERINELERILRNQPRVPAEHSAFAETTTQRNVPAGSNTSGQELDPRIELVVPKNFHFFEVFSSVIMRHTAANGLSSGPKATFAVNLWNQDRTSGIGLFSFEAFLSAALYDTFTSYPGAASGASITIQNPTAMGQFIIIPQYYIDPLIFTPGNKVSVSPVYVASGGSGQAEFLTRQIAARFR